MRKAFAQQPSQDPLAVGGGEQRAASTVEARLNNVGALFVRLSLLATAALAAWGVVVVSATRNGSASGQSATDTIIGDSCSYDRRSDPGRSHTATPVYGVDPPSGGPHLPSPASSGLKVEPAPTDGALVHSMEHGLIVVWYLPESFPDIHPLRKVADRHSSVIVVPRSTLQVPIAATAWHRRLLCHEKDIQAVEAFIEAYLGKGPERVVVGTQHQRWTR